MPGLGHVNCYAIPDARGAAVVDPGLPGPGTWRAIQDRLRAVGLERARRAHGDRHALAPGSLRRRRALRQGSRRARSSPTAASASAPRGAAVPEVSVDDLAAHHRHAHGEPEADEPPSRSPCRRRSPRRRRSCASAARGARPGAGAARAALPEAHALARAALDRPLDRPDDHAPGRARRRARARGSRVVRGAHAGPHVGSLLPPRSGGRRAARRRPRAADHHAAHLGHASLARSALVVLLLARPRRRDRGRPAGAAGPRPSLRRPAARARRRSSATTRAAREGEGDLARARRRPRVRRFSQRLFKPRSWGSMAESETYAHLEHLRIAGQAERHARANGRSSTRPAEPHGAPRDRLRVLVARLVGERRPGALGRASPRASTAAVIVDDDLASSWLAQAARIDGWNDGARLRAPPGARRSRSPMTSRRNSEPVSARSRRANATAVVVRARRDRREPRRRLARLHRHAADGARSRTGRARGGTSGARLRRRLRRLHQRSPACARHRRADRPRTRPPADRPTAALREFDLGAWEGKTYRELLVAAPSLGPHARGSALRAARRGVAAHRGRAPLRRAPPHRAPSRRARASWW